MLEKIKKFIKTNLQQATIDPARFDDPLAQKIKWTPAKRGGSNFRTHKLFMDGSNRAGFKATWGAKIFCLLFVAVGIAVPIIFSVSDAQNAGTEFSYETLFPFGFGALFVGVGSFMFYSYAKPIIFDKMNGNYWKGWKQPAQGYSHTPPENGARLSNIHAIQLLSEYVRGEKKSYYSYELNIVLKDGKRLNVVDHGSHSRLIDDAEKLSQFLGVSVWDAT